MKYGTQVIFHDEGAQGAGEKRDRKVRATFLGGSGGTVRILVDGATRQRYVSARSLSLVTP